MQLVSETQKLLTIKTFIDYEGRVLNRNSYEVTWNKDQYELAEGQTIEDLMSQAGELIQGELSPILFKSDFQKFSKVDEKLQNWFNEKCVAKEPEPKPEGEEAKEGEAPAEGEGEPAESKPEVDPILGKLVVRAASEALAHGTAISIDSESPYKAVAGQHRSNLVTDTKLMITCLVGGSKVESKVPVEHAYVILDPHPSDNAFDLFIKFKEGLKTAIAGTKAGEAGFKEESGSFFNACESVPETIKLLSDAIEATGANNEEHTRFTIGLRLESSAFFNADSAMYEIEGPKNLMDCTQMAEWYGKLVKENPLVRVLEDGFQEPKGYQIIQEKLKEAEISDEISFGVSRFVNQNLGDLKEATTIIEEEEEEPKEETEEKKEGEGEEAKEEAKEEAPAEGEGEQEEKPDPNANKYVPSIVHFDRGSQATFSADMQALVYSAGLSAKTVVADSHYDSTSSTIVDVAFGLGATYFNLSGLTGMERI